MCSLSSFILIMMLETMYVIEYLFVYPLKFGDLIFPKIVCCFFMNLEKEIEDTVLIAYRIFCSDIQTRIIKKCSIFKIVL